MDPYHIHQHVYRVSSSSPSTLAVLRGGVGITLCIVHKINNIVAFYSHPIIPKNKA